MDELQIEHRVTAVEKLAGSNRHRLEDIEKRQDNLDELVASVAVFAKEQEHIQADVKEIKAQLAPNESAAADTAENTEG